MNGSSGSTGSRKNSRQKLFRIQDVKMWDMLRKKLSLSSSESITVPQGLSADKRSLFLCKSPHVCHRLIFLRELVDSCFQMDAQVALTLIPTMITRLAMDSEDDVRESLMLTLSPVAGFVLQADYEVGMNVVSLDLIDTALKVFKSDISPGVRRAAARALVDLSCHLNIVKCGPLVLIPVLGELSSDSADQRALVLDFFGYSATAMGPELVEGCMIAHLRARAEDDAARVRSAAVVALAKISATISAESTRTRVLPIFVFLCGDSDISVRLNCVIHFHEILQVVGGSESLSAIYEAFLNDSSPTVRQSAEFFIGYQLVLLPSTVQEYESMLDRYVCVCDSEIESHAHFARAFGGILKNNTDSWSSHLMHVLPQLSNSPDCDARRSIAASLPLIAAEFKPENMSHILISIMALLADDDISVSTRAVLSATGLMEFFDPDNQERVKRWIVKQVEDPLTYGISRWKFRECVASQLKYFASRNDLGKNVLRLWSLLVQDSYSCVREAAIACASDIWLSLESDQDRTKLSEGLVACLGFSSKASDRQACIKITSNLYHSKQIPIGSIEKFFVPCLVRLAGDPAVTVRTRWAKEIGEHLRVGSGKLCRNRLLITAAIPLLTDPDREVARLMAHVSLSPLVDLEVIKSLDLIADKSDLSLVDFIFS